MFNIFNILKGDNDMGRRSYTKTEKVRNLFNTGVSVTWKQLRNKFDLTSHAMVGKLRNEGMMIYENRTSKGVSYRVGTHQKRLSLLVSTKYLGSKLLTQTTKTYKIRGGVGSTALFNLVIKEFYEH